MPCLENNESPNSVCNFVYKFADQRTNHTQDRHHAPAKIVFEL